MVLFSGMMKQGFWRTKNKMEDKDIHKRLDPEIESCLIGMIKETEKDGRPSQRVIIIGEDSAIFQELKSLADYHGSSYKLGEIGYCYIDEWDPDEVAVLYFISDGQLKK